MLLLSRKVGERIVVNTPQGDIWITLVEIDRGKIRLGIDAPKSMTIFREELLGRVEKKPPEWGGE